MSAVLVHGGLPDDVRPWDLVNLVKQVAVIGVPDAESNISRISRTAVTVLEYLISACRERDFQKGSICGVWEQPVTIASKLGISTKVLHNAEAELRKVKWIERTSTAHARRSGERRGSAIVALEGISLAPLIDGYPNLIQIRDADKLQQHAASGIRAEIVQIRRHIRELSGPEIIDKAEAILPRGRTSRIVKIEQLRAIRAELEALLACLELPSREQKSSDQTEEKFSPNILEKDLSKNCSRGRQRNETPTVTPEAAARLASEDYQALLDANGGPKWLNLIETSSMACSWLGISQKVWGEACQQLGRKQAALCVLVIDRNWRLPAEHRYRGRRPKACLQGIIGKGRDHLNLTGLLRAMQSYQEGDSGNVVAIHPSIAKRMPEDDFAIGRRLPSILRSMKSFHPDGGA
jgi:replication initiation protein RepC